MIQFWKSSKRFWIPVEVFLAPPPLDQAAPPFLSFTCSNPSGVVSTEAPRVGNSATESTLISLFLLPKTPGKPELAGGPRLTGAAALWEGGTYFFGWLPVDSTGLDFSSFESSSFSSWLLSLLSPGSPTLLDWTSFPVVFQPLSAFSSSDLSPSPSDCGPLSSSSSRFMPPTESKTNSCSPAASIHSSLSLRFVR